MRLEIVLRLATLASLSLIVAGLVASCDSAPPTQRFEFLAFGTLVQVSIAGVSESEAFEAAEKIRFLFEDLHQRWHPWDGSELTELNRQLIPDGIAETSEALLVEIERALLYSKLSGQRFHPGVALLVRDWGFAGDAGQVAPPDSGRIVERLTAIPDFGEISTSRAAGPALNAPQGGWAIDLGGIAKGVAVDQAIAFLRDMGIDNAIVNAGGDLRAIGTNDGRPWRVGIRDPRGPGVIAWIDIDTDDSVFTSGDYERYFEHEGKRYHHILDPETGYPAAGSMSVTVIAGEGGLADAAATALFVAGPSAWRETAAAMGVDQVMLISSDGQIELSEAMAARIQFEDDAANVTVRPLPPGPQREGTIE